jgi:glycosyltransferase involved in cell wall biosynthesis
MTETIPRIWIECDDLIRRFDGHATPTGICRVQFEIIPWLLRLAPGTMLCRVGSSAAEVRTMSPSQLRKQTDGSALLPRAGARWRHSVQRSLRYLARRIGWFGWRMGARIGLAKPEGQPAPGDWLLAMGGTWSNDSFAAAARDLKQRKGMRLAMLVHDILPASHPDLVADGHVARFARWFEATTAIADICFTPSRHAAEALIAHLRASGNAPIPIIPLPFGSGFAEPRHDGFPPVEGPYALFVSTIEIRKNHLFLARVWQELVRRHGAANVPKLVLIGQRGWKSEPFWRFMEETGGAGGTIVTKANISDTELAGAYRNCLFTVFPSLCEGWGLPVSESLAYGKLCVASDATSIPEAGGRGADYFDPTDEAACLAAIERVLFEPGYRQAREADIRDHVRPIGWDHAARAIVKALADMQRSVQGAGAHADR